MPQAFRLQLHQSAPTTSPVFSVRSTTFHSHAVARSRSPQQARHCSETTTPSPEQTYSRSRSVSPAQRALRPLLQDRASPSVAHNSFSNREAAMWELVPQLRLISSILL